MVGVEILRRFSGHFLGRSYGAVSSLLAEMQLKGRVAASRPNGRAALEKREVMLQGFENGAENGQDTIWFARLAEVATGSSVAEVARCLRSVQQQQGSCGGLKFEHQYILG